MTFQMLNQREAAVELGVSQQLVKNLMDSGQLRSSRAGRQRLVSKVELERFVSEGDAPEVVQDSRISTCP